MVNCCIVRLDVRFEDKLMLGKLFDDLSNRLFGPAITFEMGAVFGQWEMLREEP